MGNIILPDFRRCYKHTVIKTVWYLLTYTHSHVCACTHTHTHTQRQMGCWNLMESQEIKLHIHTCCPKLLRSCLTVLLYGLHSSRFLCPWNFSGKNTRVGFHALLLPRDWKCFSYVACIGKCILYHYCQLENPTVN